MEEEEEEKEIAGNDDVEDIKQLAEDTTFAEIGVCPEIC